MPSKARTILPDYISPKTKEFVREMLMFPLSVKNPEVPLVGGRRAKVKSSSTSKKDQNRMINGPERLTTNRD